MREILDKQVEESQSGFGKEMIYQDHAFTLKQICEKIRVRDKKIYMGLAELLVAFQENKFGKA